MLLTFRRRTLVVRSLDCRANEGMKELENFLMFGREFTIQGMGRRWVDLNLSPKCRVLIQCQVVAIKSLRGAPSYKKELVKDIRTKLETYGRKWAKLDHPNVLPFDGISLNFSYLPAMILPWYEEGNIMTYLVKHREDVSESDKTRFVSLHDTPFPDLLFNIASLFHMILTRFKLYLRFYKYARVWNIYMTGISYTVISDRWAVWLLLFSPIKEYWRFPRRTYS